MTSRSVVKKHENSRPKFNTEQHRPLPIAENLPYGLVNLTIWTPDPDGGGRSSSGTTYRNTGEGWANSRNLLDVIPSGTPARWTFDGFRLDSFTRGYLMQESQNPGPLVRLAMWALERWAVDVGLIRTKGER